jgi:hypothetical protein
MPPRKPLSIVNDDHLRAIGAVMVNWSALEMVMETLILGLYEIKPDRGLVLTANLSFQNKLTILRILATKGAIKEAGEMDQAVALLKKIEDAHIERNKIAHGLWSHGKADGLATRHAIRVRGRRLVTISEQIPLSEVEGIARLFVDLQFELLDLAQRLGAAPEMPGAKL